MWLVQADFLVLGLWSSGQVSTFYLLGANRYLVVVVVGLCQSLPLSITLTLRVARWNRVLTRVAIFNKGVVVQLVLNHTWWQRSLTIKMHDTAAVSHTKKPQGCLLKHKKTKLIRNSQVSFHSLRVRQYDILATLNRRKKSYI